MYKEYMSQVVCADIDFEAIFCSSDFPITAKNALIIFHMIFPEVS